LYSEARTINLIYSVPVGVRNGFKHDLNKLNRLASFTIKLNKINMYRL